MTGEAVEKEVPVRGTRVQRWRFLQCKDICTYLVMHLIGIMEMNAEGKDEVFSKVGEDTFHQELEKKMLAKQMKEVKKQMIQTVVEEKSSWGMKIPTALVRAVTLLLRGED